MIKTLRCPKGLPFLFAFLFILNIKTYSQAVGDYRSVAPTNWSVLTTWQRWNGATWATPTAGQGYPGQNNATANVTIMNGNNVPVNVTPANAIASLQIGSTTDATSGTLSFSVVRTLTVAGTVTMGNSGTGSVGNLTMVTGTISVNGLAVSNTSSTFSPGTSAGTVQFNATNTLPSTVFTNLNRMTFAAGTTTAGTGLTINGIVTISAGATFDGGSFTHTVGGNWINNGGTFTASTSTISFNSATANQNIQGTATSQSFNNIIIDKTGFTLTVAGSTTTLAVGGSVTVTNGTFTIPAITSSVTGATSVTGTLRISSPTGTKTFTGLVTVNTGGTWNNSGNSPVTFQGGITFNGTTFTSGTGVQTFDTNNQDLNGTFAIKSITVTGINLTNHNTLTVATALGGTGTFVQASNASLIYAGTAANTTIAAIDATASGNTVNYNGAAQTVVSGNYYNLTLSTSGVKTLQTGTTNIGGDITLSGTVSTTTVVGLNIAGNLTVGDGTTFNAAGFDLTVNGSTTVGSGTSGKISITSATGIKTFAGLIQVNTGATWNNANAVSSDITLQGGITNSGTFTSGNGVYTFNTNDQFLNGTTSIANVTVTGINLTNDVSATFTARTTLTGTGSFIQSINSSLSISGTSTITSLQATANGNTVNYSGAAQTIFPTNYYNLSFSGSGIKTMQTGTTSIGGNFSLSGTARTTAVAGLTISGNMTIGTGTTFAAGSFTHSISGNFTNNSTFTRQTSTISLDGSAAGQTIGGTQATTFTNLTINNANGVTLNDGTNSVTKTIAAAGVLTLSQGYLTTDAGNLIILNSGATASVANSSGGVPQHNSPYINGPIRKIGNQAFVFPVGAVGTGCVPIGISAPAAASNSFDAQYFRTDANTLGTISSSNLFNVSSCEYWQLNRTSGTPTVDVTGYWNENSPCHGEAAGQYVTDLTTISLAHNNGANWDNNSTSANSFTSGGTLSGGVTWSAVSTFSPFALGNNTAAKTNPLPILLDYFSAVKAQGYNKISWKAECNASSNSFIVQRSVDGKNFTNIDTVLANDATDCSHPFAYNDYTASGNTVYYRLRISDISGAVNYSGIVLISTATNAIEFIKVAPNPVRDNATLQISSISNDKIELSISSLDGKVLQHTSVQVLK